MLLSSEYRLPIVSPQRGIGTWPFFIKNLYASFFADYGNAWNAGENDESSFTKFFQNFFLGVGTELRGDFVIGHGLPVTGRVGYAIIVVNRDRLNGFTDPLLGTSMKNGTLILQLGTSF
jgi:outer membrane protein assembly factor BamA